MKRGALLLAVVAALLLGAPSVVLAAPPNRLEAATAEPTAGTALTLFHFSVRYVSGAGNPASGVTARIGPLDVPLQLASGTATDGTWSGSSLLPVGTWSLTYRATATKGSSPSLAGPTMTITGASPSPESRPGDEEPSPSSSDGADVGGPSSGPAQTPVAEPKAPHKPGRDSPTPEPAPGDGSGSRDGGVPGTDDTPEPAAGSGGRASDDGRRRGGAAPVPRSPDAPAVEDGTPQGDEDSPWGRRDLLLLLGAIVSVATIALVGTGWMLASREREDEAAGEDATAGVAAMAARVARRRRARASAGVPPDHDPVLAAFGLDQADETPQDPLRGAARGAAPRPRKAPRAQR